MEPQASWKEETDSAGSQGGSEHRLGRHAESASDPSGAAHQHRALEHTSVTEPRSAPMLKGKEFQDRTPHLLGMFVGGLNGDTRCDVLRKAPGAKEAALRAKSSPHWRVWDTSLKIQPKRWAGTLETLIKTQGHFSSSWSHRAPQPSPPASNAQKASPSPLWVPP